MFRAREPDAPKLSVPSFARVDQPLVLRRERQGRASLSSYRQRLCAAWTGKWHAPKTVSADLATSGKDDAAIRCPHRAGCPSAVKSNPLRLALRRKPL